MTERLFAAVFLVFFCFFLFAPSAMFAASLCKRTRKKGLSVFLRRLSIDLARSARSARFLFFLMPFVSTLNKISGTVALSDFKVLPVDFVKGLRAKVRTFQEHQRKCFQSALDLFHVSI